jgi:hypothetical protein
MKEYLEKNKGRKLGVVRAGFPKEVYFEAVVETVSDGAAVFRLEDGKEAAVSLDKILLAGTPDAPDQDQRNRPGFL